jgi:hypothetical protein
MQGMRADVLEGQAHQSHGKAVRIVRYNPTIGMMVVMQIRHASGSTWRAAPFLQRSKPDPDPRLPRNYEGFTLNA